VKLFLEIQYLSKGKQPERQDKEEPHKILFTGLDTAGKSTIILAIQREFSKIALLKPTRGAQRRIFEFLGKDIAEWDLGGQISYRISYLKNPGKYFDGTEILIYVVDIQNQARIPEAISYLEDVITQLNNLEIKPPIYIFFHKSDPALLRNAINEMQTMRVELKEKIKNAANYKQLYFYDTSIYNLPSIIKAMSEILLNLYPKSELIEKTINEFARKVDSEGVVMIDDNSLIVGSFYKNEEVKNLLSASTPYFLTLNDSFQFTQIPLPGKEQEENNMVVQRFGRNFVFKQIKLKEGSPPYYLLMLKQDPTLNEEDFDSFANLLKEILKN
jgi:GTPase SAR1 family protein